MNSVGSSPNERFSALWEASLEASSPLFGVIDEPYIEGSLRPERKSIGGVVAGELFSVSNTDAAGPADHQPMLVALGALEYLLK